jgi:hypothetical protein
MTAVRGPTPHGGPTPRVTPVNRKLELDTSIDSASNPNANPMEESVSEDFMPERTASELVARAKEVVARSRKLRQQLNTLKFNEPTRTKRIVEREVAQNENLLITHFNQRWNQKNEEVNKLEERIRELDADLQTSYETIAEKETDVAELHKQLGELRMKYTTTLEKLSLYEGGLKAIRSLSSPVSKPAVPPAEPEEELEPQPPTAEDVLEEYITEVTGLEEGDPQREAFLTPFKDESADEILEKLRATPPKDQPPPPEVTPAKQHVKKPFRLRTVEEHKLRQLEEKAADLRRSSRFRKPPVHFE